MEHKISDRPTYSASQFAPLFAAEDRHFWFRARNRCIAAALRALPEFSKVEDVLEVGCGTGVVLAELKRLFPGARVVGMDLHPEGLELARRRFQGPLIQGDVMTHAFNNQFDIIGAFDVIEHLDEDEKILRRFLEQLRPGGRLLLTVPARQSLWSYFDEAALHRRRYERLQLSAKLSSAGFVDIFTTEFMAPLFPAMWIKRKWMGERACKLSQNLREKQQAAAESDLKVPAVINWIFECLLWPEPYFISRRKRLPFGTSILAIATRPMNPPPSSSHA